MIIPDNRLFSAFMHARVSTLQRIPAARTVALQLSLHPNEADHCVAISISASGYLSDSAKTRASFAQKAIAMYQTVNAYVHSRISLSRELRSFNQPSLYCSQQWSDRLHVFLFVRN